MSDLQDIIVSNSIKAFNQGIEHGKRMGLEKFLAAAKFVSFEDQHGTLMLSLEDLKEELDNPYTGRNAT